ncbi:M48 family metalloprotease [Candidatus Micrarchaeota archaeon]|nr:M48 family metalloprotease [Candidatus Micrarchaeota archaeon]
MFEDLMLGHLVDVVAGFFASPLNVTLSLASLAIALLLFFKLNDKAMPQKQRISLVYLHLAFLFAPLVFLALSISCQVASIACAVTITQMLLYSLPLIIIGTIVAGFILLPRYYKSSSLKAPESLSKFVKKESKRLKLKKAPEVFSADSGKPSAFTLGFFNPRIFVSVGMQEVLSKKEIEAVLLHELSHVKNASSWFKFSSTLLKAFSPFAALRGFGFSVDAEEHKADSYAARRQGTRRHLNSAKKKAAISC